MTPLGRALAVVNVGEGNPDAVTVKDPAVSTLKAALFALVKAGA